MQMLLNAYDFAFTDWLLEQITAQGTDIIFRLGATIENDHRIKAYHIFPPKDSLKWAQICEGIINHYNHGWLMVIITISNIGRYGMNPTMSPKSKIILCGKGQKSSILNYMK